jgi:hypothetical protein
MRMGVSTDYLASQFRSIEPQLGSGVGFPTVHTGPVEGSRSGGYRSLQTNTSKARMAFSDFPFPDESPHFLSHSELLDDFNAYVDRFGFREQIRLDCRVRPDRLDLLFRSRKRCPSSAVGMCLIYAKTAADPTPQRSLVGMASLKRFTEMRATVSLQNRNRSTHEPDPTPPRSR